MATIVQRAADARPAEDPVLTGPLGSTRDGPRGQLGVLSMALSVARKRGYAWGISRSLGAAVLLEALVESRCDAVVLLRNEKVVGSIPTGGSMCVSRHPGPVNPRIVGSQVAFLGRVRVVCRWVGPDSYHRDGIRVSSRL